MTKLLIDNYFEDMEKEAGLRNFIGKLKNSRLCKDVFAGKKRKQLKRVIHKHNAIMPSITQRNIDRVNTAYGIDNPTKNWESTRKKLNNITNKLYPE